MRNWYELGPFTVFDVETTGLSPRNDRMVELAALRIDRDGEETVFHTLIHPGRLIPACASRVHHITDEMVADAPHFPQIGHSFLKFISGSTLVAHNARFDLGFLQESLNRGGLPLWKGNTIRHNEDYPPFHWNNSSVLLERATNVNIDNTFYDCGNELKQVKLMLFETK